MQPEEASVRANKLIKSADKIKARWTKLDSDGSLFIEVNGKELDEVFHLLKQAQSIELSEDWILDKLNNAVESYNNYYEIYHGRRSNKVQFK